MSDPFINPKKFGKFSKQTEKLMRDLMDNARVPNFDPGFRRSFGARGRDLLNDRWIRILPDPDEDNCSWFVIPPDVIVVPKRGRFYFFKKY